ncbi:MAG: PIG-L family deacetylase, partial [Betaproteobacteria bacterium]
MVVVSPHLDDAVFGCGALLAARPGSTVVTLFAGAPPAAGSIRTDWDARCGFADAAEAIAARRAEDAAALALLGARPLWLDFLDGQYGDGERVDALAAALRAALGPIGTDCLLYPLALFHSDHLRAHEAARAALAGRVGVESLAYEDAIYRSRPGLLQQRLAALAAAGLEATPAPLPPATDGHAAMKARA